MGTKRIVNIRYKAITPTDEQLMNLAKSNKFEYKYVPIVVYNKKSEKDERISSCELCYFKSNNSKEPLDAENDRPFVFTLYEFGTSLTLLKGYTSNRIDKELLLSVKHAFRKLKLITSHCAERIVADLCCGIILRCLKEYSGDEIFFFIESLISDKMLGRLATLYLNLERNTIVFVSSDPTDLMTTVMSQHLGKISFDLHRLMSESYNGFIGPYPGEPESSLTQAYFYNPPPLSEESGKYRPIRLDIFSQGLSRHELEDKKGRLEKMMKPGTLNTETSIFFKDEPRLLQPNGFDDLRIALEKKTEDIAILLENREEVYE